MLQYLIILLDDTATSYCHYQNSKTEKRLISLSDLKSGIIFAMKQNVTIQFVFPAYNLPTEYKETIETIDHIKIIPVEAEDTTAADVVVFNTCEALSANNMVKNQGKIFILRTDYCSDRACPVPTIESAERINIIFTNIETLKEEDFIAYKTQLAETVSYIAAHYHIEKIPKINLITDRMSLTKMNNCNAGHENITLAPNGKFYICPAFYYEDENDSIGDVKTDVYIKNPQLYQLEYAPLCRNCDAYQCKRCVWLNRKTTLEVNTPSREQCVAAHLERNTNEKLLKELKSRGYAVNAEIPSIDYLDPLEK